MKTTEEKIKVMQANCEGKAIECKRKNVKDWTEVQCPSWE